MNRRCEQPRTRSNPIDAGSLVSTEDLARGMALAPPVSARGHPHAAAEANAMFPDPGGSPASQCFANGRVATIEAGLSLCYRLGWWVRQLPGGGRPALRSGASKQVLLSHLPSHHPDGLGL
jgi:hypothetical protein